VQDDGVTLTTFVQFREKNIRVDRGGSITTCIHWDWMEQHVAQHRILRLARTSAAYMCKNTTTTHTIPRFVRVNRAKQNTHKRRSFIWEMFVCCTAMSDNAYTVVRSVKKCGSDRHT
jgi:hypothetical protein